MNPIYEEISTATTDYDRYAEEPKVVLHVGRKWEAVGESYGGAISIGTRLLHIAAIACLVAAAILLVFIPFFFKAYREALGDQIKKQSGIINVHHIPLRPSSWQEEALRKMLISLRLSDKSPGADAIAFCINIAFDGGELKKQFVIQRRTALDSDFIREESSKIEKNLEKSLKEDVNLESKNFILDAVLFRRRADGVFVTTYEHQSANAEENRMSPANVEKFNDVHKMDTDLLEEIGFARECVGPDGNFIQGKYFQAV